MSTTSFNQHFPGYEILGELGRGNARVLKARNQYTGELVAIKHFAINTDTETIRRFQRESEIMTAIKHPNIVKIKEVRLEAELPYIVMELIEGGDLRSLLKEKGTLDTATTIRLGLQMAQGFKAIHENGIIHRDIKPENIMYRRLASDEFHFLITDFGIAKLREQSHTVTGTSMMTYEYASPEQFDNPRSVTAATDYYSMGVVLYECLSGAPPFIFGEDGVYKFTQKVIHSLPPVLKLPEGDFLPHQLDALIKGLLIKQQEDRIKDPVMVRRMLKLAEIEEPGEKITPVTSSSSTASSSRSQSAEPIKTRDYTNPVPPPVPLSKRIEQRRAVVKKDNQATGIIIVIVIATAIVMAVLMIREKNKNATVDKTFTDSAVPPNYDSFPAAETAHVSPYDSMTRPAESYAPDTATIEYENGKYVGQVRDNKENGYGTRTWTDGGSYIGDWVDGKIQGKGTFFYYNGDYYRGDFVNWLKDGNGLYKWQNGTTYDGEWKNNKRNGLGTNIAASGFIIENCPDCKTYKGYWSDNLKQGFGECFDENGQLLYQGLFSDDKPAETYPNRGLSK